MRQTHEMGGEGHLLLKISDTTYTTLYTLVYTYTL